MELKERCGKRTMIVFRNEQAAFSMIDRIGNAADGGGERRQAERTGLQGNKAEALDTAIRRAARWKAKRSAADSRSATSCRGRLSVI